MPKYQSKYSIAFFEPENALLKMSWFTSSEEMSERVLKEEMQNILSHIKSNKPTKIIVDTINFRYQVTQSVQIWIATEFINKAFLLGIDKYAIVVDEDIYEEVSIQQIDDDDENNKEDALIQYFIDEDDAFDWLDRV